MIKMQSVSIAVFDDGNEKYRTVPNAWHIIGSLMDNEDKPLQGKVSLVHATLDIQISSISSWKLRTINSL